MMEISTGKMKKQVEEINRNSTSPLSGCTYEGSSSSSSVEFSRNFRKNWFDLKCKDIVEKYAKLLSKYKNCYNRLQLKFAEENLLKEENWKLKDENMDILILISSMEKDHISAINDCPTVVGSESAEAEKPTGLTLTEKLVPQMKAKSGETDKPTRFPLAGKEVLQLKAKIAEADKSTRFPLAGKEVPQLKAKIAAADKSTRFPLAGKEVPQLKPKIAEADKPARFPVAGKEVLQLKPKIAEADKPARLTVAEKLVPQWKAKSAEAEKPARLTVAEKLVPQWKAKSAEAEKFTHLPVAEELVPEWKTKSAEADKPTRLPLAAKPVPQLMAKSVDEKDNGIELLEVYKQGTTKTEICTKWEKTGVCPYKNRCQFAHGVEELRPVIRHPRYKTEVCRMITNGPGTCPFGHRCHFRHSLNPEEAGVKVLV